MIRFVGELVHAGSGKKVFPENWKCGRHMGWSTIWKNETTRKYVNEIWAFMRGGRRTKRGYWKAQPAIEEANWTRQD